jgi:hypothetical protein
MKKSTRKLVLRVETIRTLDATELKRVAGADDFAGDPHTGINCPAQAVMVGK